MTSSSPIGLEGS
uniref:Ras responsive element binding protein 1 n=3 Tax=Boreoeutheria TaxID=1437010 RepID=A0A8C5L5V2_JACJA